MICWRLDLKRELLPYVEGRLQALGVRRLEQHLLDCEPCRELTARLRTGHNLAQKLPRVSPAEQGEPKFGDLMRVHSRAAQRRQQRFASFRGWSDRLATPRVVVALALLVLLQAGLLVVSNRGVVFGERAWPSATPHDLDRSQFRKLSISELRSNSKPHVAIEGYVEDIHPDEEEGTVAFKLVEHPGASEPFVVCEIVSPIQMDAPRDGSRVRVYGVARYDAQSDRNWYEVNPVFEIATLTQ